MTEAHELASVQLEAALARADHTVAGPLEQMVTFGLLAAGRADEAAHLLDEARRRLRPGEATLQDMVWLWARWLTGAYAGRALETWQLTSEHRERFFGSFQGRMMADATLSCAAGLAMLAARETSDASERRALEREARRLARRASKQAATTVAGAPPEALLACLDGDRERALAALRSALATPISPVMNHVCRRRLGELLADSEGAAMIADVDAILRKGGVVDPERFTAAITPGLELP